MKSFSMRAEPISVLFFSNSFVRGGAEEHMLTLLRHLDRTRFQLNLMCPPRCAEQLRSDLPPDVELHLVSLLRPYDFREARKLFRILRQKHIAILHSHLFAASLAASPIGWLANVPVIIETPHVREAWRHGLFKGSYFVDRIASHFVDHYIAVSDANGRYLIEEKGLPKSKVHVIHNGCDLDKFGPRASRASELKASLNFSPDDPVLMTLGRLEAQKGHRFLLDAFALVHREFPTARLVCIGDGALRSDLVQQCERLHLGKNIRFAGFQSNIPEWLAMADFTVLPSLFEGLPLVAIESLAAERAVIATRVDGSTEVVINEETGLTVPPADVTALASAICRMLRDVQFRSRMAVAGKQWVTAHFSQKRQVQKTQELYTRAWQSSLLRQKHPEFHMRARAEADHPHIPKAAIQIQDS